MWQSRAETEDYSAAYSITLLQLNHIIAEILSGLRCICRYSNIYEAHLSPALQRYGTSNAAIQLKYSNLHGTCHIYDSPIKDCSIEYFHHITTFEALYCIKGGAHRCNEYLMYL